MVILRKTKKRMPNTPFQKQTKDHIDLDKQQQELEEHRFGLVVSSSSFFFR